MPEFLGMTEVSRRSFLGRVSASVTPYKPPLLRLGPCIFTSPGDVEAALLAIDAVR